MIPFTDLVIYAIIGLIGGLLGSLIAIKANR